ncbi:hypothetical protein S83_037943 [Arachis hypogaea]
MEKKHPCIVMVPSPGLSHLIPLVEFAKMLVHDDDELNVKFIVPTLSSSSSSSSSSSMNSILNNSDLPPNITFTVLPQVNVEDLPVKSQTSTQIRFAVKHSLPFIHQQLTSFMSSTTHHIVALVFSIFATDVLDLAKEFNLLTYVFFASGASLLSFCLYLPYLDETVFSTTNNTMSLTETVNFPGCVVPFQIKDLPDPVLYERSSEVYKSFLNVCRTHSLVDGAIVNTFTHLESEAIAAIQQQQQQQREANDRNTDKVPPFVYPIGPIIQSETSNDVNRLECLRWLDNQPPRSVLYISFGSGGTLPQEQLNEIAFGLEMSGHKFLWVVRAPNEYGGGAYLNEQKEDPLHHLPSGFVDRTKGEGLVVPSWAPQVEILGHGSTSAFLSHCGWNSILESVVHGVPMIAWPLFAEQRMNAVLLKEVLKVALMPEKVVDNDEDGIVKREEIARVIKRMMEENEEGLEMRKRIKHLSDAAAAALTQNGSSTKAFSTLKQKWKIV